jgi:hypothetical protein
MVTKANWLEVTPFATIIALELQGLPYTTQPAADQQINRNLKNLAQWHSPLQPT